MSPSDTLIYFFKGKKTEWGKNKTSFFYFLKGGMCQIIDEHKNEKRSRGASNRLQAYFGLGLYSWQQDKHLNTFGKKGDI